MPVMQIQGFRERLQMSRRELAAAMGVYSAEVVAWECETYLPKARQLPLLAQVLHCTIDDLFIQDETQSPV